MNIIQASIPLFFLLIVAELLWSWRRGQRVARLNDSIADISCGVMSQMAGIFDKALTLGVFIWIGAHASIQRWLPAIPHWPDRTPFPAGSGPLGVSLDVAALASWAITFFLVDFCYYWSHRLSHEVHVLWAGHVVHHQSEEYNLAVALRQATLGKLLTWIFYVPLAFIGIPWRLFVATYGVNLVYQFVLHTRTIGTLGPVVERIMNTPSHHRVHHGVNPQYQDRNYAGVFIIFDRWFGTFEKEVEPVVYGVTKPLTSWNPVTANLQVFSQIWHDVRRATSWHERWHIVFGHPGWRPAASQPPAEPPRVTATPALTYDPPVPTPLAIYGFAQMVLATGAAVMLLGKAKALPVGQASAAAFLIVVSLVGVAGVFERAQWVRPMEGARLLTIAMLGVALAMLVPSYAIVGWLALGIAIVSGAVIWRYRDSFTEVALAPVM